ncbi:MAG TPA: RNA polymerase sigma-70 factor [Alistipes onderdonkii]|jgi:RNA polymerase sigma-70 factor (ECF subfamily)|nr:RNA polymerase sigma-70 factor [Alistipes onderdonkii]HJF90322.1 RNA polymerase sigma-70 factor [Alistipes onderdonkii]
MDEERRYLEALARDDRSAFDALYLKYATKTEEFLYRMLKDHSEAEDITQDIFLKIWRNRTSIGAVDAFGPYLFRMARNAVYDRFDNRSVRENYARRASLLPEYELPDSAIDSRDLLLLIRMVVEKMPEQRRRIFRMSREEGLSNDQIAEQLSISRRTVENQISRALAELRKLVKLILFFF